MTKNQPTQNFKAPGSWWIVPMCLTLGLVILWFVLVGWEGLPNPISVFLCALAELVALGPNEIGDSLAGIGSIIALIWLIAGLRMQFIELRNQREEFQRMVQVQESSLDLQSSEAFDREVARKDAEFEARLKAIFWREIRLIISDPNGSGVFWGVLKFHVSTYDTLQVIKNSLSFSQGHLVTGNVRLETWDELKKCLSWIKESGIEVQSYGGAEMSLSELAVECLELLDKAEFQSEI